MSDEVFLVVLILSIVLCGGVFAAMVYELRQDEEALNTHEFLTAELRNALCHIDEEDFRWFVEGEYTAEEYINALNYGARQKC